MKIPIKQSPEDFIVEEIIKLDTKPEGRYLYAKITKTNLNTLDVVNILQNKLHLERKFISFAGSKDKRAITTQYFSIKNIKESQLKNLSQQNLKIEFAGYNNNPISLGSLEANKFIITLKFKPKKITQMPNYFGEQRFSKNNKDIGKALIQKQFKAAAQLIASPVINSRLKINPLDFVGAIKLLDRKLISLYINSYQSYLWNKALTIYLKSLLKPAKSLNKSPKYIEHESLIFPLKKIKNIEIPLISFDTEFKNKTIKKIYEILLKEEYIQLSDFIIRQFPDQTPISTMRNAVIEVKGLSWKSNKLTFILPKGSYATVLIKQIEAFSPQNP